MVTARTDTAARPALQGSRQDRWEKVASGAAEQCGRAVVPIVAPAMTLDELLTASFVGPPAPLRGHPPSPSPRRISEARGSIAAHRAPGGMGRSRVHSARRRRFRAHQPGPAHPPDRDRRDRGRDRGAGPLGRPRLTLAECYTPPAPHVPARANGRQIPDPLQPGLGRLRHRLPGERRLDRQEGRDQGPAPPER